MTFFHVDIDAFFAQAEQLANPRLRGKPVIVGGSPFSDSSDDRERGGSAEASHSCHSESGSESPCSRAKETPRPRSGHDREGVPSARSNGRPARGVVAAVSYEGRQFGIRSGMPLFQALRLCPHAIVVPVNFTLYERHSEAVHRLLDEFSPRVDMASIDEAYLDMAGCERLYPKGWFHTADRLRLDVKSRTGLNVSIGIASDRTIAKIASDFAKPNGVAWVFPGSEMRFLAPLPVGMLPGVGPKTSVELEKLGIMRVSDLAGLPAHEMQALFGSLGTALMRYAAGPDGGPKSDPASPIRPDGELSVADGALGVSRNESFARANETAGTISHEETLEDPTSDAQTLERHLRHLVCRAVTRLRRQGLCAGSVRVKLRQTDFKTFTRSHSLASSTDDEVALGDTAAKLLADSMSGPGRRKAIRLVGVALADLRESPGTQEGLFSGRSAARLRRTIDRVRAKHGVDAVLPASAARLERKPAGRTQPPNHQV
ncbi:MAG: DNA polymerase IV [Planctomycetota bacterium]|nr:DNA polymerase IV [Planctomycetota bacterium]